MTTNVPDKIHYVRIPDALGGRAEMIRLCYVLAERPYTDVLHTFAEAPAAVAGKNPFKQFPFVETGAGECVYQSLAIMHHAAHGTPVWPSEPRQLTHALMVALGGYDLYQAFGAFPADDLAAKKKFEEKKAPQLFGGLADIYSGRPFATGDRPSFADCIVHEAVAWCVRRNDASRALYEGLSALTAFQQRFESLPAVRNFIERQAAARRTDNTL